MKRGDYDEHLAQEWRTAVWKHRKTPDSTRVLLLYISYNLRTNNRFSEPATKVAPALGITERRLLERYRSARQIGWLHQTKRGQKGVTAEWSLTFPRPIQGDASQHPEKSGLRHPERPDSGVQGAVERHPSSRADLSAGPTDRDVGSDEEEDEPHGRLLSFRPRAERSAS